MLCLRRIGVIGLDGLSRGYLNKLIERGVMVYTKHLMEHSEINTDLYCYPPVTLSSWPTILSGVNPAKHGIYDFFYYDRIKNDFRLVSTLDLEHPRIHEMLAMIGRSAIVINPVPAYPIIPIKNTIILSIEFFTPKPIVYPQEKAIYLKYFSSSEHITTDGFEEELNRAKKYMEGYISIVEDLLTCHKPDLLWINLHYPDSIFHKAAMEGKLDILYEKTYSDEVKVFSIIDKLIRLIDNEIGNVAIVSDHGFAEYNKYISVNTILYKAGLVNPSYDISIVKKLETLNNVEARSSKETIIKHSRLTRLLRHPLIKPMSRRLKRLYERITGKKIKIGFPVVDYKSSLAFMIGRASNGVIVKKPEYIERVRTILKSIKGIAEVKKREEVFEGRYLHRLPELFIYPEYDAGYNLIDPKIYDSIIINKKSIDHHPYGIFIMKKYRGEKINVTINNFYVTPIIQDYVEAPISIESDVLHDPTFSRIIKDDIKYTDLYVKRWTIIKRIYRFKK